MTKTGKTLCGVWMQSALLSVLMVTGLALLCGTARAATFAVTKTADTLDGTCDADCSLREAVTAANAAAGDDTITLPAGTYTLTIAGTAEDGAATGDLDVTDTAGKLTLNGAGAATTIIQAGTDSTNGIDRVFDVKPNVSCDLSGVTMRYGIAPTLGGAIKNEGTLTVQNCTLSENFASTAYGGAINNIGTLTVQNCTLNNNSAGAAAGALANFSGCFMTVRNSTLSQNSSPATGGILNDGGTLTVQNCTVSQNSSPVTPAASTAKARLAP